MKKLRLFLVAILSLFSTVLLAQQVTILRTQAYIGSGTNHAMVITLPEANAKDATEAWKKFLSKKGGSSTGDQEILTKNIKLKDVSPDLLDFYTIIKQHNGFVEMTVAIKSGIGFLHPEASPVACERIEHMIKEFAVSHSRQALSKIISTEKQALKKLTKEEGKIEKESKKLNKKINKYNKQIEKSKKQVDKNNSTLSSLKSKIEISRSFIVEKEQKLKGIK